VRRIGQEFDARTYTGIGPHPSDRRALAAAAELIGLIEDTVPGTRAEHVGSTAVPNLEGKNVIDLQITADPDDVPAIAGTLLGLGFARQRGPDPWPPERPMLEGTYACRGAVFGVHAHVIPTTDPEVKQMAAFRDLLRDDPNARETYAAEKRRIVEETEDVLEYTHAKTHVIRRLLARRRRDGGDCNRIGL